MIDPIELRIFLEGEKDPEMRERIRKAYQHIGAGDPDNFLTDFAIVCVISGRAFQSGGAYMSKAVIEAATARKRAELEALQATITPNQPKFDLKAIAEAMEAALEASPTICHIRHDADLAARGSGRMLAIVIIFTLALGIMLGAWIF
ncbi:hypothetical protein QT970_03485 [Microcoleus sp. herbarium8]|uniref:hypothetical protein n=1 Tax=Microcoleus sp. herbarium8 TaxID=3055436 RepID=UPI002FD5EDA5